MDRINSLIHTYSSKPILAGTRDALIVATITVIILVIIAFVYYAATGNLKTMGTGDYWISVGRSFLTSLILGYVYEYGGINARFSAEAMRFAKGSTLDVYQTSNEALVAKLTSDQYRAEVLRELQKNPGCSVDLEKINEHADKLHSMIRATRELKMIARMYDAPAEEVLKVLTTRYRTKLTLQDINNLRNLDPDDKDNNLSRLRAVSRLVELLGTNTELLEYFMKNGFSKLRSIESKNGPTIDVKQLSKDTGVKINLVGIGNRSIASSAGAISAATL